MPSPLPNLDHKIMQGNSLISEYEGIKLFDDDFLHDAESNEAKINEIEIESAFLVPGSDWYLCEKCWDSTWK